MTRIFGRFLNFLKNWFLLSNLKSECCNSQIICTKIFIKFLLQDKKWERLQNRQKYILQQKNVVAGKNMPYDTKHPKALIYNCQPHHPPYPPHPPPNLLHRRSKSSERLNARMTIATPPASLMTPTTAALIGPFIFYQPQEVSRWDFFHMYLCTFIHSMHIINIWWFLHQNSLWLWKFKYST